MSAEVNEVIESAMTVEDVLEALEGLDPKTRVLFVCSYGDYHRTQQALPVTEIIPYCSSSDFAESGYSTSGIALIEDNCDEMKDDVAVVIMR